MGCLSAENKALKLKLPGRPKGIFSSIKALCTAWKKKYERNGVG